MFPRGLPALPAARPVPHNSPVAWHFTERQGSGDLQAPIKLSQSLNKKHLIFDDLKGLVLEVEYAGGRRREDT